MANAVNPYGDGRAAQRTTEAIEHMFGLGSQPVSFRNDTTTTTGYRHGSAALGASQEDQPYVPAPELVPSLEAASQRRMLRRCGLRIRFGQA
jgi:hypothetical protein